MRVYGLSRPILVEPVVFWRYQLKVDADLTAETSLHVTLCEVERDQRSVADLLTRPSLDCRR